MFCCRKRASQIWSWREKCHNIAEVWEVGIQLCLKSVLILFLESVDTPQVTSQHGFTCSPPNQIIWDSSCLLPLGNKTMREKTTTRFERRRATCLGISGGFILNETQWLNFPSLIAWKTDTSRPLEFFSLCCCRWKRGRNHAASTFSLANSGMTGFLRQLQLWMTAFYLLPAN